VFVCLKPYTQTTAICYENITLAAVAEISTHFSPKIPINSPIWNNKNTSSSIIHDPTHDIVNVHAGQFSVSSVVSLSVTHGEQPTSDGVSLVLTA